jgi:hypothetical protein
MMSKAQETTSNDDFLSIMFQGVELMFPRLDQTYRFNKAENRTEPCAATVSNSAWSVEVKLSKELAKPIHQRLKAHYEARRALNKKLPEFSGVFGMKKDDETNTVRFAAKKKGVTDSGKVNKPPTVIDGMKNPVPKDALEFWSGTTANVRVRAFPTQDPDGKGGISLLLDVIQVIKPVYGGANLDDFDVVADEPAEHVDNSDFEGQPEEKPKATAKAKPATDDDF